ncbi:MAG: hypothetical protein JKY95_16135 [Planctomycetaceae bacterium]|nr:hypothetical protein [Planctomycetaceae bacterium]
MTMESQKYELPSKVDSHLAVLSRQYDRKNKPELQEIIVNGVIKIEEGWHYDNWNGGTYGHAITFQIPEDLYLDFMDEFESLCTQLRDDINKLNNTLNEDISEVFIEMLVTEKEQWRERSGKLRKQPGHPPIPNENLEDIWGEGHVRIFLSHSGFMIFLLFTA